MKVNKWHLAGGLALAYLLMSKKASAATADGGDHIDPPSPNNSKHLTDVQVGQLLYTAGFRNVMISNDDAAFIGALGSNGDTAYDYTQLETAILIVLGESSGYPSALGDGGHSYGLAQVNDSNLAWIKANCTDITSMNDLLDGAVNARVMYAMFTDFGFKPWRGPTKYHTLKAGVWYQSLVDCAYTVACTFPNYPLQGVSSMDFTQPPLDPTGPFGK